MKKDKLEDFIRDKREDFDNESPSPDLWNRIDAGLPVDTKKRFFTMKTFLRVAAIFTLGALSYAVISYWLSPADQNGNALKRISFSQFKGNKKQIIDTVQVQNEDTIQNVVYPVNQVQNTSNQSVQIASEPQLPIEFQEVQAYYQFEIARTRGEIFRFASDRPEISRQIDSEFVQMDSIYNSLKRDLRDNVENREVVEAMILNYRVKLEILEMILQQLRENEKHDKEIIYEI